MTFHQTQEILFAGMSQLLCGQVPCIIIQSHMGQLHQECKAHISLSWY